MNILDRIAQDPETMAAPGASGVIIAAVERRLGIRLPRIYKDFLTRFDGGEFRFARMLASGELIKRSYDGAEFLAIGDDYAGEAYCLDLSDGCDDPPVVLLLSYGALEPVTPSFTEFLASAYDASRQPREVIERVEGFRALPAGACVDLPLLAPYGLALHLLDVEVLDAKHDPFPSSFEQPAPPPASRSVVLAICEPGSGATDKLGSSKAVDLGPGDISIVDKNSRSQTIIGKGSCPRKLFGPYSLQTVLYVECAKAIEAQAVLQLRFTVMDR